MITIFLKAKSTLSNMSHLINSFKAGKLNVKVFKDRESLGKSAANESGEYLINLLKH